MVIERNARDAELLGDIAADRDQPTGEPIDAAPLRAIAAAVAARRDAEQAITASVDAARAAGLSWGAIGAALGVSRQAALKRYARILGRA